MSENNEAKEYAKTATVFDSVPEASLEDILKMVLDDRVTELEQNAEEVNILDVLGMARAEIRHSNILAWLLNPYKNPDLAPTILRGMVKYGLVESYSKVDNQKAIAYLQEDFGKAIVQREWNRIDIFVEGEKTVLCIENKVDSPESPGQLKNYREIVKGYCGIRKKTPIYFLLSPDGRSAMNEEDAEHYIPITYETVAHLVRQAKETASIEGARALLVDSYLSLLEREFMNKSEKDPREEIAKQFYKDHRAAVEYLISIIPDELAWTREAVEEWLRDYCKSHTEITISSIIDKKYVRFQSKKMTSKIGEREDGKGGWKDNALYYYEILIDRNKDGNIEVRMQLAFNTNGLEKTAKESIEQICKKMGIPIKKNTPWIVSSQTKNCVIIDHRTGKVDSFNEDMEAMLTELFTMTEKKL